MRDQADPNFLAESETLPEMLARIRRRTGRPVALVLDQFEDYLRCHNGTDLSVQTALTPSFRMPSEDASARS